MSDNRRYLVDASGKPFFYLADTAWRLLYCTDHAMADHYLRKRRNQGFSVFMAVILSEVFGTESETNRFGHYALVDWDPCHPNEAFFEYVDWVVRRDYERTGRQVKPVLDGECRYEYSHEFFWSHPPSGRRFLLAYLPEPMPFHVDLDVLRGPARLAWFDVRTGATRTISDILLAGIQPITPIEEGGDGASGIVIIRYIPRAQGALIMLR